LALGGNFRLVSSKKGCTVVKFALPINNHEFEILNFQIEDRILTFVQFFNSSEIFKYGNLNHNNEKVVL